MYEVGFGSGSNLQWAYENGWEVAGCEVADLAFGCGRRLLPDADLRLESIVECTAPSGYFDVVIDRAAMTCVPQGEIKQAVAHVRRILKPGGIFFFNPYGVHHDVPFPPDMPPATFYTNQDIERLLPDAKWNLLELLHVGAHLEHEGRQVTQHTLRVVARKRG